MHADAKQLLLMPPKYSRGNKAQSRGRKTPLRPTAERREAGGLSERGLLLPGGLGPSQERGAVSQYLPSFSSLFLPVSSSPAPPTVFPLLLFKLPFVSKPAAACLKMSESWAVQISRF